MMQQQGPSQGLYPTCPPLTTDEEQQKTGPPPSMCQPMPTQQTYIPLQPYQVQGYLPQPVQQQYVPGQPQQFVPAQPQQYVPGQHGQQQNPSHQSVVYQRAQSRVWPHYRCKSSLIIGWIQICIGLLCITFNAIGICLQSSRKMEELNGTFMVGAGFWGSIFYFLSGGFAIAAAKNKTTSMIVANMVFSILSTIFALAILCSGASAIGVEKSRVLELDRDNSYFGIRETDRQDTRQHRASLSMGVLLVGLSLLEFVCCIWSSIICCSAVCCGRTSATPMNMAQTQVIYMNPPQGVATGQPIQGVPAGHTVMMNNPVMYNQPQQAYIPYPAGSTAPPSYDSTVGPTIEKQ